MAGIFYLKAFAHEACSGTILHPNTSVFYFLKIFFETISGIRISLRPNFISQSVMTAQAKQYKRVKISK